jgi:hypothetical protein
MLFMTAKAVIGAWHHLLTWSSSWRINSIVSVRDNIRPIFVGGISAINFAQANHTHPDSAAMQRRERGRGRKTKPRETQPNRG